MKIGFLGNAAKAHVHRWAYWLNSQGHEVVIFSDKPPLPDQYYEGIKIVNPHWGLLQKLMTFKLSDDPYANNRHKWKVYRQLIDAEKPDILHAHEALVYGPTLAHFSEYPRVLTPWGPDMELLAGADQEAAALVRQAVESADVITTNGPGLESHWAKLSGVPEEKFRLFPWGINRSTFHPRPDEEQLIVRQDLGIPPAAPIILSPRLAKPLYRIDTIMEAWTEARKTAKPDTRLSDGRLVVLRSGASDADWNGLKSKAQAQNDESILLVEKWLDPKNLAALLTTASAAVMIPKTDLLAMSLLECISCGSLPILADLPAYHTIAGDLAQKPADHVWALLAKEPIKEELVNALRTWNELDDETRIESMAHNIDIVADQFDWDDKARQLVEVYEHLLVDRA